MRTTKGSARTQAKRRLFRKAKGYRGGRSKLLRTAKETVVRSAASLHGGSRIDGLMQGGALYFIGEGTRLVTAYEPLFHRGTRDDALVKSGDIAYPNALVLTRKTDATNGGSSERLVLLFNEESAAKTVHIENLELGEHAVAEIWEGGGEKIANPATMTVRIPARDVTAVYISDPAQ